MFGLSWGKTLEQPRAAHSYVLVGWVVHVFLLLSSHVDHEVHHPVAVTTPIVVPGNEFYKVVIESNASPASKAEEWVSTFKVAADNLVLSVSQDTF